MKKISNREEANNYYKVVNKGVDEFSEKTKARPSEVHKYLSRNGKKFLKQLDLSEVDGIEYVLQDVLSHRKHLEDDKIITFESFSKINEGFVNIGSPTIEHEKVLSDKFGTSLGHIEVVDPQSHLFKINDFGKDLYAIIFNESEISLIKKEISKKIEQDLLNRMITMDHIGDITIESLKFWVSDFVDIDSLQLVIHSKVSSNMVTSFITANTDFGPMSSDSPWDYSVVNSHHIWVQ